MKRILVTGAAGFIGRQTLEPLAKRGFEVHAALGPGESPLDVASVAAWHSADLMDPERTRALLEGVRASHLLHLAWYAVPGKYQNSEKNLDWAAQGTGFVRAFREAGGERAVLAGSSFEYDWDYGFCHEARTPIAPKTLYGVCKHALHTMAAKLAEMQGFELAWARLFFLFGPHEQPGRLISSVAPALLKGEPALCTHGRQIRDFIYVKDAGRALAALAASPVTGPVNIGSGRALTLAELVGRFAKAAGSEPLVRLGAREAPPGEPPLFVADIRRLEDEVGFTDATPLDRAIEETLAWWRRELGL